MNWLDIVVIVCVAIGVIKGLFDGLIKQAVSLVSLALAILFAGGGAALLQRLLGSIGAIPERLVYPLCYVFSFAVIIALTTAIGRILEKIWKMTPFGCLNHLAGGVLGFTFAVISLSLIFNFLLVFDKLIPIIKEETRKESASFERIRAVVPALYPYFGIHKSEK